MKRESDDMTSTINKLTPVFIIGAGRSGTKYLRETLFASESCTRIPYDVGYVWRYGNEGLTHDEIDADRLNSKQIEWIQKQLYRLVDKDHPKPKARVLIEKSVTNSLRPALVARCFPGSKFIHIIREGHAVVESAVRMWQKPPEKGYLFDKIRYFPWSNYRYGIWFLKNNFFMKNSNYLPIWGPRYYGLESDVGKLPLHVVCAKQWSRCVEVSVNELSMLSKGRSLTVVYENLMTDESEWIRVCEFIGIDPQPVIKAWQNTVQRGNDKKWRANLTANQVNEIEEVFNRLPLNLHSFFTIGHN